MSPETPAVNPGIWVFLVSENCEQMTKRLGDLSPPGIQGEC